MNKADHVGTDPPAAASAGGPPGSVVDGRLVAEAIRELSADHRVVIIRAYRGWSVAQLAAELDVPPGTVRTRLFAGLQALRAALHERGLIGR